MKIELFINGEKKLFTAPFVPMLARRKFLELQVKEEDRGREPTAQEQIDENDEMYAILANVVFKDQFKVEDLYEGASKEYLDKKLMEAVFGVKPDDEGNEKGK